MWKAAVSPLSLRDAEGDPWQDADQRFAAGTVVTGTVESRSQFGLFVSLAPGITGLLPAGVIKNAKNSGEFLQAGQGRQRDPGRAVRGYHGPPHQPGPRRHGRSFRRRRQILETAHQFRSQGCRYEHHGTGFAEGSAKQTLRSVPCMRIKHFLPAVLTLVLFTAAQFAQAASLS